MEEELPQEINDGNQNEVLQQYQIENLEENYDDAAPIRPRPARRDLKILVVGYNGCGKSSLVNRFAGKRLAECGTAYDPTIHELVKLHNYMYKEVPVGIYDIRGFGDIELPINEKNITAAMKEIKKVDIVLICHKLYDPVDERTEKLLILLSSHLKNAILERSIIVYTFGDGYTMADDSQQNAAAMNKQCTEQADLMKRILTGNGIDPQIVDNIPSCITCGKWQDNLKTPYPIPTSNDWVADLWDMCNRRCGDEPLHMPNDQEAKYIGMIGIAIGLVAGLIGGPFGLGLGAVAAAGMLYKATRN